MRRLPIRWAIMMFAILSLAAACAPTVPLEPAAVTGGSPAAPAAQKRTAVLGISSAIPAFSFAYVGTSGGGSQSFDELWRQGLVTTARTSTAPEPRIAAELPSIDRGTAVLLPDGRLQVTWRIRPEVKWADGTDLTARDYAFGLEVMKEPQNPLAGAILVVNIAPLVERLEIVDDKSFVLTWHRPFYLFDSLGFFALQPVPTHVLRGIWNERNFDGFAAHAYWRADNSINTENAMELKEHWGKTGEGRVYIGYGTTRAIFPMFNPETQAEPAMLDARVRQALYMAIDKETWAVAMLSGNRDMVSHSLLPPDHSLYEFTRDSFRAYSYDPQRAIRMLDDLGWSRGADGSLRNRADGRPFKQEIWTGAGTEGQASILSDMWQNIGLQPNIFIPRTAQSNRILGQSYPGVEISARGGADGPLRAECATVPVAPRWDGANRGHYCNREMDRLIAEYRGSLTRADQGRWIAEVARFYANDLPSMQLYFNITRPVVAKGLTALAHDFGGGTAPQGYYGSYMRNAHEWEWTQ